MKPDPAKKNVVEEEIEEEDLVEGADSNHRHQGLKLWLEKNSPALNALFILILAGYYAHTIFRKHGETIVYTPGEVQINEIIGERTIIFKLHVGDGDIGKVIDRSGHTATSLRTLLAVVSAKYGKRSVLEILDLKRMENNAPNLKKPAREITARKPVPES